MKSRKRVLVIGASGFIGSNAAMRLRENCKVFGTFHTHPIFIPGVTPIPLNIFDREGIKRIIYSIQPDAIVYCLGDNRVDWVEKHFRDAERLHSAGLGLVAGISDILQPKIVLISNAYVFDGRKGNYKETDVVLPSLSLGRCKLAAENFLKGKSLNYVIIRSGPVFGRGTVMNPSWFDQMRMKLSSGKSIELLDNDTHSFVPMETLADLLERVVDSGLKNKILHLGGLTKLSTHRFGLEFAKRFGFSTDLIRTSTMGLERRPGSKSGDEIGDYSLNSSTVIETLKLKPLLLEESFDLLEKNLVPRFTAPSVA